MKYREEIIGNARLILGDCRDTMATFDECSIESIVTDPPYELDFMGRSWDRTGIAFDVAMWKAALRVLKPGGYLIAFSHARTYHRMACAIEDAGFEIRDQIMWIYGSGFPKGGNRDGKGTCLKPAHEPIVMARKPFKGSVAANEAVYGTGALNIGACRVDGADAPEGRVRNGGGSTWEGSRFADRNAPMPAGRWPANVIHDGSGEVLAGFPNSDSKGGGGSTARGFWGNAGGCEGQVRNDTGSAARFFYCAKASKADRDEGLDQFVPQSFVQFQTGNGESGKASSLSEGRETQYRNTHPTVKPTSLMRYLARLVTPIGGVLLDPFMGSGSTGKAAMYEGFRFIGCELSADYLPIAAARIQHAAAQARAQGDMFAVAS